MDVARGILPDVEMFNDPYEMAKGCDALMVVTEWNEFKQLDLEKLKGLLKSPVIFDGRNIYDPAIDEEHGLYVSRCGTRYNLRAAIHLSAG